MSRHCNAWLFTSLSQVDTWLQAIFITFCDIYKKNTMIGENILLKKLWFYSFLWSTANSTTTFYFTGHKEVRLKTFDFVHSRKRTPNTCLLDIMSHDCNEITFSWMNEWWMNKWVRLLLSSCKMAFQRNVYARYAHAHYLYFFQVSVDTSLPHNLKLLKHSY